MVDNCTANYGMVKNTSEWFGHCKHFSRMLMTRHSENVKLKSFIRDCCSDYKTDDVDATSQLDNYTIYEHQKELCSFANQLGKYECSTTVTHYYGESTFDTTSLYVVVALISPIGILANLLVLTALTKSVRARNNVTLFYIRNLAVADLLTIACLILVLIVYNDNIISGLQDNWKTYLFSSLDIFVGSASLTHITAVSMDRAFAVLYPMKHLSRATICRGIKTVVCLWIFSLKLLVLSLLRIVIDNTMYIDFVYIYTVVLTFFIPCLLVITAYVAIIVTVIKTNFHLIQSGIRASSTKTSRYREIKLAFNVIIIIIPYVCGWGYVMILTLYEEANGVVFTGLLDWFTITVPFLVSCINPIVYLLCTASLKKYSIRLLRKWCNCKLFKPSQFFKTSFRSSTRASNEQDVTEETSKDEQEDGDAKKLLPLKITTF